MPKVRKNKSKDNVVPFNKPKVDKVAEEKRELRQSEQDRLNAVIKEKCSEILEIIDLSQIEKKSLPEIIKKVNIIAISLAVINRSLDLGIRNYSIEFDGFYYEFWDFFLSFFGGRFR